jgi:excisionase family DNA binding protein
VTKERRSYSTCETAEILGVHEETIRKWCRDGKIRALKMCDLGNWHIPTGEIERLFKMGVGGDDEH